MNALPPTLLYDLVQALGWTLLHFLWQGAFFAVAFLLLQAATAGATPRTRYRAGMGLFAAMAATPAVTFWYLLEPAGRLAATEALTLPAMHAGAAPAAPAWLAWEQWLEPYLPWAVAAWLAGVILMSLRVSWDWWQVRRMVRRQVAPLPPALLHRIGELSAALGVRRPVKAVCSYVVRVPAVVGWVKPVILLPAASLAKLDRRQLELVIAHELAHIRRADYLVNLFQVLVETLLFYHPAVRWMSNRLRADRELCCDDEVLTACGDALTYAKALTELESQRMSGFQTALAASGGQLSQRIHRMLESPLPRRGLMVWGVSLMLVLAAGSAAVAAQIALRPAPPAPPAPRSESPAPVAEAVAAPPAARAAPPQVKPAPPAAAAAPKVAPASSQPALRATAPDQTPRPPPPSAAKAESPDPPAPTELNTPAADQVPDPQAERDETLTQPAPVAAGDASERPRPAPPDQAPVRLARAVPASPAPQPLVTGGDPVFLVAPDYPWRARARGIEGTVIAEFSIDAQGRVQAIDIVQANPGGVFNRAVENALKQWRFEPLRKGGEAVTRRVSKRFEFTLEGGSHVADNRCDPRTGTRICRSWIAQGGDVERPGPGG